MGKDRQMSLRYGAGVSRRYADYKQASALLAEDLVWSSDFESIRLDLARLINLYATLEEYPIYLTNIVQSLIADENDLTI